MKRVLLVEQLSAVSPTTETETDEDKTGSGVNVFVLVTNPGELPTQKVYVTISDVEVAVKVTDSPSQKSVLLKAVELKFI